MKAGDEIMWRGPLSTELRRMLGLLDMPLTAEQETDLCKYHNHIEFVRGGVLPMSKFDMARRLDEARTQWLSGMFQDQLERTLRQAGPLFYDASGWARVRDAVVETETRVTPHNLPKGDTLPEWFTNTKRYQK